MASRRVPAKSSLRERVCPLVSGPKKTPKDAPARASYFPSAMSGAARVDSLEKFDVDLIFVREELIPRSHSGARSTEITALFVLRHQCHERVVCSAVVLNHTTPSLTFSIIPTSRSWYMPPDANLTRFSSTASTVPTCLPS